MAAAATAVAETLVITIAVLGALAALGGAAFVTYRLRRLRHGHTPPVAVPQEQVPWRLAEPLLAPRRPAVEPPREMHLHFHGVTAEEMAAIIYQQRPPG